MKIRQMSLSAMMAALLVVCSWLAVPAGDGFVSLQTFGVCFTLGLLGPGWGSAGILVYLLLGAAGLPVFSGFRGGFGVLLGATGGYLWGFLAGSGVYGLCLLLLGRRRGVLPGMIGCLLACYGCGTLWYAFGYLGGTAGTVGAVILKCVLPYVIPDGCKVFLAWLLVKKLKRRVFSKG